MFGKVAGALSGSYDVITKISESGMHLSMLEGLCISVEDLSAKAKGMIG